jgi:hypothetical protein
MIQANELRVNNWIFDNIEKRYVKINLGIFADIAIKVSYLSDFNPIPLAPAILEKSGFKYDRSWSAINGDIGDMFIHKDQYVDCEKIVLFDNDGGCCLVSGEYTTSVKFFHLHRLQNLFFALTGQELEVEPI